MTLTILLTILGTSIDTLLLCYCTKYFDFRYSYIKSGIIYTLWGLSIIVLNLLSCPFIFKLVYELISIVLLFPLEIYFKNDRCILYCFMFV